MADSLSFPERVTDFVAQDLAHALEGWRPPAYLIESLRKAQAAAEARQGREVSIKLLVAVALIVLLLSGVATYVAFYQAGRIHRFEEMVFASYSLAIACAIALTLTYPLTRALQAANRGLVARGIKQIEGQLDVLREEHKALVHDHLSTFFDKRCRELGVSFHQMPHLDTPRAGGVRYNDEIILVVDCLADRIACFDASTVVDIEVERVVEVVSRAKRQRAMDTLAAGALGGVLFGTGGAITAALAARELPDDATTTRTTYVVAVTTSSADLPLLWFFARNEADARKFKAFFMGRENRKRPHPAGER